MRFHDLLLGVVFTLLRLNKLARLAEPWQAGEMSTPTLSLPADSLGEIVRTFNAIQAELEEHWHSLAGYVIDIAALEVKRDAVRARVMTEV